MFQLSLFEVQTYLIIESVMFNDRQVYDNVIVG